MAEEALDKIEEQLQCSICLDTYTDPKLLQCFHVYCQQCLVKLVVRQQQDHHLTCPICRQATLVPRGGLASLQPAFHINRLMDIKESLLTSQGSASKEIQRGQARHCFQHPEEELRLYCNTCGVLICYECVIIGEKHHDHSYAKLHQAFGEYNEEIMPLLKPMKEQIATIEKALSVQLRPGTTIVTLIRSKLCAFLISL